MTILRSICLFIIYISNIQGYSIIYIKDNKPFCTNCFKINKLQNITSNRSLYYCDICNINNTELCKLNCNLCKEVLPCRIDTGCFNCDNCTVI